MPEQTSNDVGMTTVVTATTIIIAIKMKQKKKCASLIKFSGIKKKEQKKVKRQATGK